MISTNKAVVVTALELSIDVFLSLLEYDIQKSVQTAKYTCQSLFSGTRNTLVDDTGVKLDDDGSAVDFVDEVRRRLFLFHGVIV